MPNMPKIENRLQTLDREHFYFDGVLMDLNQLYSEANSLAKKPELTDMHCHSMGFHLDYINHVAKCLHTGDTKFLTMNAIEKALRRLNELGLHTGWTNGST